jgi:TonB family protein
MVGRRGWARCACLFVLVIVQPCRAQSDPVNEWHQKILASLQSHARFPREPLCRNGAIDVAFTLDREGKLVSASIASGTGVAAIDDAALEMVRGAQPFPPAPPEISGGTLKIIAKVPLSKSANRASCELWSEEKLHRLMRGVCRGC